MIVSNRYNTIIEENVQTLNSKWIKEKIRDFRAEVGYDDEKDSINLIQNDVSINYIYDNTGVNILDVEYIDLSETICFDIYKYCSSYLPLDDSTDWGTFPYPNSSGKYWKSNNLQERADALISELSIYFKSLQPNKEAYDFIFSTIREVGDATLKLKNSKNAILNRILDEFVMIFTKKLLMKYDTLIIPYERGREYVHKLDFKINQENLVSLLYILSEAGILKENPYNYNNFLNFAFNHFRIFKKENYKSFTEQELFNEAYLRILREKGGKGVKNIKDVLIDTFRRVH